MKTTNTAKTAHAASSQHYLSPQQVCDMVPGLTIDNLAQMRHRGTGPIFRKPSPRTVTYLESDVHDWLDSTAMVRTDLAA